MDMEIMLGLLVVLLTYGPFLLAIATIIWLGVRGKPAWSAPTCARCKYDLRGRDPGRVTNCPECGADLLRPKAVLFMKGMGRRWGLITWGAALLVMPVLGVGAAIGVSSLMASSHVSPSSMPSMSTQSLLQQQLPTRLDEPWVWNELEARAKAGTLTQQEAEDAVTQFTQHMKTTKPNGWDQPLHWQNGFMSAAEAAGLLSDAVIFDFCDAYYGSTPMLRPLQRVRVGQEKIELGVHFGNTWDTHHGLSLRLVWGVKRVLVDGKSVTVREGRRSDQHWSGSIDTAGLVAGDHEIEFELDCILAPSASLVGVNATTIPVANVPNPKRRWTVSAKQTLTIYTSEAELVKLIDDPTRDPRATGTLVIERIVVEPLDRGRKRLNLALKAVDPVTPCSFDIAIEAGDQRWGMGGWYGYRTVSAVPISGQLSSPPITSGSGRSITLADLDPSITSARVIFTPNAKHIEHRPEVTEIWGKPIVFENVPIDRLDLPAGE